MQAGVAYISGFFDKIGPFLAEVTPRSHVNFPELVVFRDEVLPFGEVVEQGLHHFDGMLRVQFVVNFGIFHRLDEVLSSIFHIDIFVVQPSYALLLVVDSSVGHLARLQLFDLQILFKDVHLDCQLQRKRMSQTELIMTSMMT